MGDNKCDVIKKNSAYFDKISDGNSDKYKINDKVFENKKIFKFVGDEIKFSSKFFSQKDIKEHCYHLGLEKWHDWFTIPYYYLTNNIESGELSDIYKDTWSLGKCYDKCDGKKVVLSNIKGKCIDISLFKGGKYKNYLPYDPIALISIIGTYVNNKKTGNYGIDIEYSYEKIIKKYTDEDIYYNNINIKDIIKYREPTQLQKDYYYTILNSDISEALKEIISYIKNIIDESLKITNNVSEETKEKYIYEIIENDLNKFYYLFDDKDEYYMNYLTNKIACKEEKLELGKYCGAQYAYGLSSNVLINNLDIFDDLLKGKEVIYKKGLKKIYDYSKELCFSSNYLFFERLKNFNVISENKKSIDTKNNENEIISIHSNNNTKIKKESMASFDNYEYILRYFNSLPTLAYFLVVVAATIMVIYYILFRFNILYAVCWAINFVVCSIFLFIPSLFLYAILYIGLYVFTIIILLPLNFISKLYGVVRPYLKYLLLIFLFIMFITAWIPNGFKIIIGLFKFAFSIFKSILFLILNIIIWILKQPIIISLIIIYTIYILYHIIFKDLELLGTFNLDLSIKREFLRLRISQYLYNHMNYGIKRFSDTLENNNIYCQ